MKNPLRTILCLSAIFTIALASFFFLTPAAHAQDAAPITAAPAVTAPDSNAAAGVANAIVSVLSTFLPAKFAGWLVAIGSVVGVLRLAFKPLVTAIESYVKSTPSTSDDEFVKKLEGGPVFKAFAWFLDFFASIKIGPQFTAKPEGK